MTDPFALLKSHPNPHVRRAIASAALDVPTQQARVDTKARALAALREQQIGTTTALSAMALGNTVSRLVGSLTQAGRPVSPWKLALRGAYLGASAAIAALLIITATRYMTARSTGSEVLQASSPEATPGNNAVIWSRLEEQLSRGQAAEALAELDRLEPLPLDPDSRARATLLRIRALTAQGRTDEARSVVARALANRPTPDQARALEQLQLDLR